MSATGVGASVGRKEDDRFLRGHGQYVADFRHPGLRDVAFVRSAVAHARIRAIHVPADHKDVVFTAEHLAGVNPIRAATALRGFKHSGEPILATGKVRYVGEIVAMCVGGSRAEAEDIAALVRVDYDELPPVTDMLAARRADAALVHEEWGDNVFIEFFEDGAVERVAQTAAIKVTREIRTARHCMLPIEGRGVVAYWDPRLAVSHRDQRQPDAACRAARHRRVPGPPGRRDPGHFSRRRRRLRLQGPALPRGGGAGVAGAAHRRPRPLARGLPRASHRQRQLS